MTKLRSGLGLAIGLGTLMAASGALIGCEQRGSQQPAQEPQLDETAQVTPTPTNDGMSEIDGTTPTTTPTPAAQ